MLYVYVYISMHMIIVFYMSIMAQPGWSGVLQNGIREEKNNDLVIR